ncbi:CpaF family protein [Granulicella paludicola]|uniref:CpaF family protein n=1 Tax=Granulicella paludicola TaxID=474951 RepID=UPI0021E0D44D|nr:CpaF family protein [Granulicella paludicola]
MPMAETNSENGSRFRPVRSVADGQQQQLKAAVHKELIRRLDLERISDFSQTRSGQQQIFALIQQLLVDQGTPLSAPERDRLAQEVVDEVFGLGPLEPLLKDPTISDILVNTYNSVYVERRGLLEKTSTVFNDNAHLMQIIDRIVSAVGRRVDESSPMVDARLADGSRVNVIIPPLAVDGPILSIRRFGSSPLTSVDLVRSLMLTQTMLDLLQAAVAAKLNIVVSGGTGAGKTTLLNVLSGFIGSRERIVTIEDSAELLLKQEHVVRLETRPPNMEGNGAIRQRELVINALRMRPDRIVLGEVRGEECLDMLQAMNTGHDGSITTVHANTPRDALARMETMAMMGNIRLPEKAIKAQITSAVHLIVQVARMSDGTRRITHISELTGAYSEAISMNDLIVFEKKGLDAEGKVRGRFRALGIMPQYFEKLVAAGIPVPEGAMNHVQEV